MLHLRIYSIRKQQVFIENMSRKIFATQFITLISWRKIERVGFLKMKLVVLWLLRSLEVNVLCLVIQQ